MIMLDSVMESSYPMVQQKKKKDGEKEQREKEGDRWGDLRRKEN